MKSVFNENPNHWAFERHIYIQSEHAISVNPFTIFVNNNITWIINSEHIYNFIELWQFSFENGDFNGKIGICVWSFFKNRNSKQIRAMNNSMAAFFTRCQF